MAFLRALLRLTLAAVFVAPLQATWSIILIDTRTGEVAIGSATCLTSFDLQQGASIVVVGRGAAAAQSFVDQTGLNRLLIWNQFHVGTAPAQILAMLAAQDPDHQTRQYGIVDTLGRAIAFTGTGAGAWASHVTGTVGTISYAVQGNVLTGQPVVTAAEQAILNTPGDLAEKLMAAMQAAQAMGGDGRCSCGSFTPTQCGAPPASFTKSAHIGYMVVARPGDTDGICTPAAGCANGSYYLNFNIANQLFTAPDPVDQLRAQFLNWRLQHVFRPDHYLSTVTVEPTSLLDDGATTATLEIELRDWRGVRVPFGGAQVSVAVSPTGITVPVGAAVDHGDGTYSVPIGPSSQTGTAVFVVTVDDGMGPVQLGPPTEVAVTSDTLWVSRAGIDAVQGGPFEAVLRGGASFANRYYLLLATTSGTAPGVTLGPGLVLPLQPDPLTFLMLDLAPSSSLLGTLDGQGRRSVPLLLPPGLFGYLTGGRVDFAWLALAPIDFTSNPQGFDLR